MTRYIADARGGTCSGIIDLASPDRPPSVSQAAPGLWKVTMPAGPAIVGHCFDAADPADPVFTNGEQLGPDDGLLLHLDCPACASELVVNPAEEFTWLLVEHRRGCAAMASWTAGRT